MKSIEQLTQADRMAILLLALTGPQPYTELSDPILRDLPGYIEYARENGFALIRLTPYATGNLDVIRYHAQDYELTKTFKHLNND